MLQLSSETYVSLLKLSNVFAGSCDLDSENFCEQILQEPPHPPPHPADADAPGQTSTFVQFVTLSISLCLAQCTYTNGSPTEQVSLESAVCLNNSLDFGILFKLYGFFS